MITTTKYSKVNYKQLLPAKHYKKIVHSPIVHILF